MRSVIIALFLLILTTASASAYWQYAEWGMTPTQTFFFDGQGRLDRTVVTFKDADVGLISGLLQGIYGPPLSDQPGSPPTRIYRDARRGSTITVTGGAPVIMSYRPGNP